MRTAAELMTAMTAKQAEIRTKMAELNRLPILPKTESDKRAFQNLERDYDALVAEFDALSAEHARLQPSFGSAGRASGDQREQRRAAIEDALLHRSNPRRYQLSSGAREFAGSTLVELARDTLQSEGVLERGMSRQDIAQRSLMASADFPLTLANVVGRTLRDSYQAAPRTFQPFAKQITLSDFKAAHRVKLGDAPQLLEVLENGEFKRGSMTESDETIKLRTYGRVVGITRQVILNDDLGAFTKLPQQFGISAANLESNIVWALILSNPTLLTDATPLFHAKHNNLFTGGGNPAAAPSVTSVGLARTAMSKQRGDGDGASPLNLRPDFIVVPPELETAVQQLLFGITPQQTSAAVPASISSLKPISEPRLSTGVNGIAGSATGWYLFASPDQIDTIEYAYLDGQDGPYTEQRNGWEIDGLEVKCRHDFGAAAIDYRGAAFNAGA